MKKILLFLFLSVLIILPAAAQKVSEDREISTLQFSSDGRLKAGLALGYPSGLTVGYHFSNWFEGNLTVGYLFGHSNTALLSANGLFTLINLPAGDAGVIPLSLGPQVNFIVGNIFSMEILGDLRLEYTFTDTPLNLYAETAIGVLLFNGDGWITWNGGFGVRYVF